MLDGVNGGDMGGGNFIGTQLAWKPGVSLRRKRIDDDKRRRDR